MPRKHLGFWLLLAVTLAVIAVVSLPRPASAQCGSAASSCKDCHETKKVAPVNTKGNWHTAHAFGDFCEFCHAGNAKSKDKLVAHTGMLNPIADVKGACQSCHPNDFMDRAKKYADTLGKTVGTGSPPSSATAARTTTTVSNANCGPAAPTDGQTIDLNKVYAGLDQVGPNILGNAILIALIVAVALVLAGLAFYYEKPLPRAITAFRQLIATPAMAITPEGVALTMPERIVARPELGRLMPLLSNSDPATVRAVTQLLSDRENGPRVLKALSHLDLGALAELSESDQKALASLMALAKELKS